ncbi:MAG TPA: hypothetical protein VIM62_10020, partial [Acidobacteriaceae bacterium]
MISKDAVMLPYYQQVRVFRDGVGVRKLGIACAVLAAGVALAVGSGVSTAQKTAATTILAADNPYRLPPEKLKQARALGVIRPALSFGSEGWEMAALTLLLATGGAARLERWAQRRAERDGKRRGWIQAGIFATVLAGGLFLTVDLPFAAVGHAYSLRYGISVEGWDAWALDEAKMLGLMLVVEVPVLMSVFGLMRWQRTRRLFWMWAALGMIPVML